MSDAPGTRYVFVTGGVVSALGKGIVAASLGRLLKARGHPGPELGRHAGLTDTALMLAVDARLVRRGRLRPGTAADGVDGDPTRATAELGRPAAELIVSRTVDAVRKSITHR